MYLRLSESSFSFIYLDAKEFDCIDDGQVGLLLQFKVVDLRLAVEVLANGLEAVGLDKKGVFLVRKYKQGFFSPLPTA